MKKFFTTLSFLAFCTMPSFGSIKIDVIKVYDGDSVLAQYNDNIFRIRLVGIDCFEGAESNRAKWQARKYNLSEKEIIDGGNKAGKILEEKLKNKNITFDFRGIDKYDRALGILYANKTNINKEMLKTNYCNIYGK